MRLLVKWLQEQWQPSASESATDSPSTVGMRRTDFSAQSMAGISLSSDPTGLLWQSTDYTGRMMAAGFLQTASAGTLRWRSPRRLTRARPSFGNRPEGKSAEIGSGPVV